MPRNKGAIRHRTPKELNLQSLARSFTEMAIRTLAGICQNGKSEAAQVSAAALLLERGWGKALQARTGNDGEGPVVVEIVYRTRERETKVIDHAPRDEDK